ncbi:MAG: hypothetical protein IJ174_08695 [Clostridia bacterium]|nr:hypothetical protein [Clostridia bacterium]
MKKLQELYNEIMNSDELKTAFAEAVKNNNLIEFAKAHDVETSVDEIKAFLENLNKPENEKLAVTELENAAGGTCNSKSTSDVFASIFTGGTVCALVAQVSLFSPDYHSGKTKDGEGFLCNPGDAPKPGEPIPNKTIDKIIKDL